MDEEPPPEGPARTAANGRERTDPPIDVARLLGGVPVRENRPAGADAVAIAALADIAVREAAVTRRARSRGRPGVALATAGVASPRRDGLRFIRTRRRFFTNCTRRGERRPHERLTSGSEEDDQRWFGDVVSRGRRPRKAPSRARLASPRARSNALSRARPRFADRAGSHVRRRRPRAARRCVRSRRARARLPASRVMAPRRPQSSERGARRFLLLPPRRRGWF